MSRTIFLSFLGTNNYIDCNYFLDDNKVKGVKYVQEAMLRLFNYSEYPVDEAYIFLTEGAREKNWKNDGHRSRDEEAIKNQGLKDRLRSIDNILVHDMNVKEGYSEKDLWSIFEVLYDVIKHGDRIYLDITHGFRSLPMLANTLLSYAKTLKNIKILGVYYGAFEKLGPAYEVKKMEMGDRNAPILDVTSISTLQEWSSAADSFNRYGISRIMADLINKEVDPRLRKSKGKDEAAHYLKHTAYNLLNWQKILETNRGAEIFKAEQIRKLNENLHELLNVEKVDDIPDAFEPLIKLINKKVNKFDPDSNVNWIYAVEWCIDHGMVQQGITQLQEGCITHLINHVNENYSIDTYYELWDKDDRSVFSSMLQLFSNIVIRKDRGIRRSDIQHWGNLKPHFSDIKLFQEDELFLELIDPFTTISDYRNDVNHGGFAYKNDSDVIIDKLNDSFKEIKNIILTHATESDESPE